MRINRDINDSNLIQTILNILINFAEKKNEIYISKEVEVEVHEIILWSLNIFNDLIREGVEIVSNSKVEAIEQKRKEYIVNFINIEYIH